jgi:methionine synthase I (cobalamin-dependent)
VARTGADSDTLETISDQLDATATASALSTVAGYLDTEIAAILADTNELQTDWTNGGRLDLIVDAILADTSTDGVAVAAASVRGAIGMDAANLDTQLSAIADDASAILEDTGTTLPATLAAILEDTGTTIPGTITTIDTLIDRCCTVIIGTVSGAGTGTEVFVYGGVTATVTVDDDGNRSAVTFS